jgi:hypothetical protein
MAPSDDGAVVPVTLDDSEVSRIELVRRPLPRRVAGVVAKYAAPRRFESDLIQAMLDLAQQPQGRLRRGADRQGGGNRARAPDGRQRALVNRPFEAFALPDAPGTGARPRATVAVA